MTGSNRLWTIGGVTAMIILLAAGWFLGAQPFISAAASADEERTGIEAQNTAQQAEIVRLTAENKDLPAIQEQYAQLLKSIPSRSDTAAFIDGLNGLAASSGLQVTGITVSESMAYTLPASAAAAAAAAAQPTDGATPAPEATTAPAPVVVTGSVAATSPLITPENFVGISVGVDLKGGYQQVLDFVQGLQSGNRLVLVTGITSTADPDGSGLVTSHITGIIYVLKQES